MLKAVETLDGGVTVASIEGRMTLGTNLMFLEGDLKKLIEAGSRKLVLNLAAVHTIDSAGLGVMIGLAGILKKADGEIRLAHVPEKVREVLEIVKVQEVLPAHDSVESAASSFLA
jgi:anti-sigma B factor antagonist